MAPAERSAPANNLSAPLEGPISLLWAYQLRREHAFLLTRVDSLADTIRNEDATAQIKQLKLDLTAARDRTAVIEKEVDSHRFDIQAVRARVSGGDEAVTELQGQVAEDGKHQRTIIDAIRAEQENISTQIEQIKGELEKAFESKLENQQAQVLRLQSKTIELEGQIIQLGEKEIVVIKDSIEGEAEPTGNTDFRKPQLINNSNVSRKLVQARPKPFSNANDLLQEIEKEDSNMLALQLDQRVQETPGTEFDLDAGVNTLSYARHCHGRITSEDSLATLPELTREGDVEPMRGDQHLAQGGNQTWENYISVGRNTVRSFPKRKEGTIVDKFVEGIFDNDMKAEVEVWLNAKVWIWEHVEAFTTYKDVDANPEPSSTVDPTPEKQPEQRKQDRRKERVRDQGISREMAGLLQNQGRSLQVETWLGSDGYKPSGNRRSQRLAKRNEDVAQQPGKPLHGPVAPRKGRHLARDKADYAEGPHGQHQTADNHHVPRTTTIAHSATGHAQPKSNEANKPQSALTGEPSAPCDEGRKGRRTCIHPPKTSKTSQTGMLNNINIAQMQPATSKRHIQDVIEEPAKPLEAAMLPAKRQQVSKHRIVKNIMFPSTPTPINHDVNTVRALYEKPIPSDPNPYATPQNHLKIGRISYKRKFDRSAEAAVKRVKIAKRKKRGPPPPIPILPSSDTE